MSRHRRVFGYARVSSVHQVAGSSLRDQQEAIQAYATSRGLTVTRMFVESESAVHEKFERREQIQALMAEVRKGDLVVVDKLDRWSRDPEFSWRSTRELREAGASFFAVAERLDPDTPEGDTMLNFRIAFAREEHKRIKERMVGTRRLLRDRGLYVEGLPPLGYVRGPLKSAERNVLRPGPDAEKAVRAFKLAAAGWSLARISEELEVDKKTLHHNLRSRVYVGDVKNSRGEWIRGVHPALIDADLFERAGAAMSKRKLTTVVRGETRDWILRDVAVCSCGAKMTSAYAGPPGPTRKHFYRCFQQCGRKWVPVRAVESEAEPLVLVHLTSLGEMLARDPKPARVVVDTAAAREKLARKRARYLEAFADEAMTRDELRAAIAKLDAEALKLDAKDAKPAASPKVRAAVLRSVKTLAKAWMQAGGERRRAIVRILAESCALELGQSPAFVWKDEATLTGEVHS